MTVTNQRLVEILTTAMEKPEIANALIQRVINTLNRQAQHEWQGLTDEEIQDLWSDHCLNWQRAGKILISPTVFGQTIEAKLKEKNT